MGPGIHLTRTEVLGITKGASKVEIKKAYHKVGPEHANPADIY